MKKFAGIVLAVVLMQVVMAQSYDLNVQKEGSKLFLDHTVAPKENWYSIGRLYNISPKEIAPFNGTALDKPLSIGQHLKVPLEAVNFSQDGIKAADESFVAVYHIVQDKEGLPHVSASYNNVSLANLGKWNRLAASQQPKTGAKLVVGYLKVKPLLSALATGRAKETVAVVSTAKKDDVQQDSNPVAREQKKPAAETSNSNLVPMIRTEDPSSENNSATATHQVAHSGSGFFISEYSDGSKKTNGTAGTFKSTSGWQDGKYYALLNNVAVGTIVKVSIPTTNKTIYAKVLGPLPDMKESAGLTIRISNAAANELGQGDVSFPVDVRY